MLLTARAVAALILREMATSYGRSPGGFTWAFVEPMAGITLLSVVLSVAFHAPPLGQSFPLFYATGLIPFLIYSEISSKVAQAINFSRPLLAYPSVTFVDALLARFAINFLVQIAVANVLLFGIVLATAPGNWPDLASAGVGIAMSGALGFGVGTCNCFLLTRFPIWQRAWSILNRPLFLVSAIFFVFETLPERFRDVLWWNPIVHVVGEFRRAFYESYQADYVSPAYVFGLSLALTAFGMIFLRRYHRELIED